MSKIISSNASHSNDPGQRKLGVGITYLFARPVANTVKSNIISYYTVGINYAPQPRPSQLHSHIRFLVTETGCNPQRYVTVSRGEGRWMGSIMLTGVPTTADTETGYCLILVCQN